MLLILQAIGACSIAVGIALTSRTLARSWPISIGGQSRTFQHQSALGVTSIPWLDYLTLISAMTFVLTLYLWGLGLLVTHWALPVLALLVGLAAAGVPARLPNLRAQRTLQLVGQATLPRQVYAGDSFALSVNLRQASFDTALSVHSQVLDSVQGKLIGVQLQDTRDSPLEIQAALLAAGISLSGDASQRKTLGVEPITFRWVAAWPSSGYQTISVVVSLVSEGAATEILSFDHKVRVVQIDHLTARQVWIVSAILGVLPGAYAVVSAVLGYIRH